MGFYSINGAFVTEGCVVDVDSMTIPECYSDNLLESAMMFAIESTRNFNSLMEGIGIHELNVLEETGSDFVYEAVDLSGFFSRVKEIFNKIIATIKSLFNKIIAAISSFTMSNKDFVKKYRTQIYDKFNNSKLKDFKVKGYAYPRDKWLAVDAVYKNMLKEIPGNSGTPSDEDYTNMLEEAKDMGKFKEKLYGAGLGKTGTAMTRKEFVDALNDTFRGSTTKETFGKADISSKLGGLESILESISGADKAKTTAKKTYDTSKRTIESSIKTLNALERTTINERKNQKPNTTETQKSFADKISAISSIVSALQFTSETILTVNGVYMASIKDELRRNKTICTALLTAGLTKESASVDHYTESGSFIYDIKLK